MFQIIYMFTKFCRNTVTKKTMSSSTNNGTLLTPSPTVEAAVNHEIVGIGSILFVLVILITLFSGKLISIFQFHHINESTVSILFGLVIGIIVTFLPKSSTDLFQFDPEFFFCMFYCFPFFLSVSSFVQ